MIKIIFYTYIFVRWTGGWGIHTGLGAWAFFALWTAFMVLSVFMAALGPLLTIVSVASLFGMNPRNCYYISRMLQQPAGRALIMGHWGTMSLTALICYIAYFFTGETAACISDWNRPATIEWLLFAWYGFSVYSFFKNGSKLKAL